MKKLTLFSSVLALLLSSFAVAQNSHTATPQLETALPVKPSTPAAMPESQRVIWSENFSNGIPSTWSQTGTPSNALWEYRGPNTTPNDTVGSRGAFAGDQAPIASNTRSNGFIIFDSSFLDNAGISSPLGTGIAPAPHVGRIFTNTIDLSNENAVEIKIESYLRRFQAAFFVAFSTDGGTSYNDKIEIAPLSQVAVNASSGNVDVLIHNVSNIIGGQSQVVIQFIFDGTPGNANVNGY